MEAWLALAGTVFGGVGLKVIESFLGRNKTKGDDAHRFRDELRAEILVLRTEADKIRDEADVLRDEIDEWRTKYFTLVADIARGQYDEALGHIKKKKE
jgi:uncharacterized coiled-coil DUF342 family protein